MYWSSMAHSFAICQAACPWNFESNLFHDTIRNLNQYLPWFRRPAVWGYKLFYGTYKKKMDPAWAKTPVKDQGT